VTGPGVGHTRFASDFSHVEGLKTTKLNASSNHRHLEVQPRRDVEGPHQFRTGNDAIEVQRTRSNSNKTGKSTELVDILPLIAVWLQVRVLPGPRGPFHENV
jgi:hypothetical protein